MGPIPVGTIDLEIWEEVLGFEGLYEVSSLGRVRGLKRGNILKPTPDRDGYLRVSLSKDGKWRNHAVHHLVLNAFVGVREPGEETRHLDNIKSNCRLDNLEWSSHQRNMQDNIFRENMYRRKFTIEQVSEIRCRVFERGTIESYCASLGITRRHFHAIRAGRIYAKWEK